MATLFSRVVALRLLVEWMRRPTSTTMTRPSSRTLGDSNLVVKELALRSKTDYEPTIQSFGGTQGSERNFGRGSLL